MPNLMPIFLLGAMWLILLWVTPYFWARSHLRGSPSAKGPVTLIVSETGLHMRTQHVDSSMEWSTFVKWVEEKQVVALLTSPKSFVTIPKRAFEPNQLAEFRELLRRKVV